ncbi:MAG: hypothetical protein ABIR17_12425 [Pseudolysinimonas sp.]|uniref:hypothetical protein n=1 Tax=Pseudolysinimonas sp. TaxID=2680009 RepID=UPI00326783A6
MSEPLPAPNWRTGTLDFSAFSVPNQPVEDQEVQASFWPTIPRGKPAWNSLIWLQWIIVITGYLSSLIFLPVWLSSLIGLATASGRSYPGSVSPTPILIIFGVMLWVFIGAAIWGTFRLREARNRGYLWWRLLRFATANGLTYRPWAEVTDSTTSLVRGNERFWFEDGFRPTDAPEDLTIATLVIGGDFDEFNAGERRWGFVELRLDRSLPHIVVETTARGRAVSDYGMSASQAFELEGDFPHYARVYADEENRATALELLTPDVMAAIVDEIAGFDLEVRGDRLSMTSPTMNDLAYPATLARLFRMAAVIGEEARAVSMQRGDARYSVEALAVGTPPRMRQRRIPRGAIRGFIVSGVAIVVPTIVLLILYGLRAS